MQFFYAIMYDCTQAVWPDVRCLPDSDRGAVRIKDGNSSSCQCQILVSADLREVIRVLSALHGI